MRALTLASQNTSICARCQLRILGAFGHLRGKSGHVSSSRNCASASTRRQIGLPLTVPSRQEPGRFQGHVTVPHSLSDLRAAHGLAYRHLKLNEENVSLGVDSLGEPAQIRILKDKPRPARRAALQQQVEETEDESAVKSDELLRALQEERQKPDLRLSFEHIEQIRTSLLKAGGRQGPTLKQCRQFGQQLVYGFNRVQIQGYAAEVLAARKTTKGSLEAGYEAKVFKRTSWVCGSSKFPEVALERLGPLSKRHLIDARLFGPKASQHRASGKENKKASDVEALLRERWLIRPREEKQQLGEIDFKLGQERLEVLLKNHEYAFEKISKSFGVRIDVSPAESIVRLTAEYGVASDALAAMEDVIESVEVENINVALTFKATDKGTTKVWDAASDEAYLRSVEELSKTVIFFQKPSASRKTTIARVHYSTHNPDSIADARRLLTQTRSVSSPGILASLPVLDVSDLQKVAVDVSSSLPIHDRRAEWSRLRAMPTALPVSQRYRAKKGIIYDPELASENQHGMYHYLCSAWDDVASPGPAARAASEGVKRWDPNIRKTFMANFGSLIHAIDQDSAIPALLKSIEDLEAPRANRKLILNAPDLITTLAGLVTNHPSIRHELRIVMLPTHVPETHDREKAAVDLLPRLEIHVDLDEAERVAKFRTARLVRDARTYDLMLHRQATDLRFKGRAAVVPLTSDLPQVQAFLRQSSLDVWGHGRLRTPESLDLTVPRFALKPRTLEASAPERPAWEGMTVRYALAQLEHRSEMHMLYQGYPLVYTTIEAGLAGGRRTELRLEAEPLRQRKDFDAEISGRLFEQWYGVAHELVARIPN